MKFHRRRSSADALARRVKFFSIGSNDLIQYSLAVDRTKQESRPCTSPRIPRCCDSSKDRGRGAPTGIWVGVCGEMAGDPALMPLLIGLGVDELSAAPVARAARQMLLIRRSNLSNRKNWRSSRP